jgi:hypothetical protein
MEGATVIRHVERLLEVRALSISDRAVLEEGLRSVGSLQSWLASTKATLTTRLAALVTYPEPTLAGCTRDSARDTARDRERADTLQASPKLADALDDARLSASHVDEVTRAGKRLDRPDQRRELLDRIEQGGLIDRAADLSVEDFRRRLGDLVRNIQRDEGMERLERQRRATRLRTWTDGEGMWCISGRYDPVTGVQLAARLDAALEATFAEALPSTAPSDPIERQHHLRALALAGLLTHDAPAGRPGRPEFVVVVDATRRAADESEATSDPAGLDVDWGLPVEIPHRVLAELLGRSDAHAVVVRSGVVLHAPGTLDLGRSTRLANQAQRRALRALYRTCAVPGCGVHFDRCKIHHVVW